MPDGDKSDIYCVATGILDAALERGLDQYDICIAGAVRDEVRSRSLSMSRRKAARDKLNESAPELFALARDTYRGAAGALRPDAAGRGVVACYVDSGLDMANVVKFVKTSAFALKYA